MILVGVDGSRAGLEAVAWAAREAALRDLPLLVAHAMPRWAYESGSGPYAEVGAWMREGGRSVLEAAEERARREQPKIVVVREQPLLPSEEIVAGVDGSPASYGVLEFAFKEARLRAAPLRVVHARTAAHPGPYGPGETSAQAGPFAEQYPDVELVEESVHGHPVDVLLQAASRAGLLVAGSHGHRAFAGMILGSVTHELLHRSPCPLAVVRGVR